MQGESLRRGSTVEQAGLASRGRREPEVRPAAAIEAAPPCRARDDAKLNEEGLDDALDRVARLAEAGGERFDAHRSAAIKIGDHRQIAPVHRVEPEPVDFEPVERL